MANMIGPGRPTGRPGGSKKEPDADAEPGAGVGTGDARSKRFGVGVPETSRTAGEVVIRTYPTTQVESFGRGFKERNGKAKLRTLRDARPDHVFRHINTITKGFAELQARYADRDSTGVPTARYLAIGDDNSVPASYNDESLNNERYRTAITDSSPVDDQLTLTTLIASNEANDIEYIREVGIWSGPASDPDSVLMNHALVNPQPKTTEVAVTVQVTFTFGAASA